MVGGPDPGDRRPDEIVAEAERQLQLAYEALPDAPELSSTVEVEVRGALLGVVDVLRDIEARLEHASVVRALDGR